MQKWKNQTQEPQQIDVLLFDDFSALCLANTIEPMRAANRLLGWPAFHWRFLSLDNQSVTSSSGMSVSAHETFGAARGAMLVVMPSYGFADQANIETTRALREAAKRYDVIAGFDTGSWLLAAAGLLDGKTATIHWEELDRFAEAFPEVQALRQRSVTDGNRLTCSGAQAAFDLMLGIIAQRHGAALRIELASLFMSPERDTPQDVPMAQSRAVELAVQMMQAHIEEPRSIGAIATAVGRHQKDLEQRMRAELGASPRQVYRRIRLLAARKLLREQAIPITEVALRVGYQNASAMTRAYRIEFGCTPRDERNR